MCRYADPQVLTQPGISQNLIPGNTHPSGMEEEVIPENQASVILQNHSPQVLTQSGISQNPIPETKHPSE